MDLKINMAETVTNAEVRAALSSINYNGANYQTLTGTLAIGMLGSLAFIAATYIAIQGQDQTMGSTTLVALAGIDIAFIVLIILAYFVYLRNIGRYVLGRMRPVGFDKSDATCRSPSAAQATMTQAQPTTATRLPAAGVQRALAQLNLPQLKQQ
jgi:Na+-transporting methylmalonyl-CoA/oxaloacetate decarboxylase gamma subunit